LYASALSAGLLGMLPLAVYGAIRRRRELVVQFAIVAAPLYLIYVAMVGGDVMLGRLLIPALPLVLILGELGARILIEERRWKIALPALAIASLALVPTRLGRLEIKETSSPRVATLDPDLRVRVIGVRALHYTTAADPDEDRPSHVRAASGLAFSRWRLVVIQDDTAFIATVGPEEVAAIALPVDGRRRFEVALGNKQDKLDLEACVAVGEDVWAFGSGSSDRRERIVVIGDTTQIVDASALYRKIHDELGGAINLEGAASVGEELWLFHRGNTGPDDPGPAAIRFDRAAMTKWLQGIGPVPSIIASTPFDLGTIGGVRLGFTDAVAVGSRAFYLAAAEASPNAIDDGVVTGSQLGVIDGNVVRAAPLEYEGTPLKAEGIAFDPSNPRHAWISVDPDDVDRPAQLFEVELVGRW
nr:hypothetical protein [Deltaproteobacteria bacterium]